MTVAVQYNMASDSVKYRPCIDLSRCVNKLLVDLSVSLEGLSVAEVLIKKDDFMTALDLKDMYLNIRLHPSARKYLGFAVPDDDGSLSYYQFCVMPFGIKPTVSIVTRLLKPVKAYFRRLGIKFSIYIDDRRTAAASAHLCDRQTRFVVDVLQRVGWHIQFKKSVLVPTQKLLYLGFLTDSVLMRYVLPDEKWSCIKLAATQVLSLTAEGDPVPVKDVASVLGKFCALIRSHGSIVTSPAKSYPGK